MKAKVSLNTGQSYATSMSNNDAVTAGAKQAINQDCSYIQPS